MFRSCRINKKALIYFNLKLLLFVALIIVSSEKNTFAQRDAVLYNMSSIPQHQYNNPAQKTNCLLYLNLPVISSVYLDYHNNGFVFTDLVQKRADDSLLLNMENLISTLKKTNVLGFAVQTDWLGAGFSHEKNHFFFNISEKAFLRLRYPKDFVKLLWEGNAGFIGQTADLAGLALKATHYREYAFGMGRELNDQWTVGAKLKILSGMQNISTNVSKLSLSTAASSYELTGNSDMVLNTSIIADENATAKTYLMPKNKNWGAGMDMGVVYKLSDKLAFSASIIDLSYIKWKHNVINYSNDLDEVTFKGNSINNFTDSNATTPFETLFDSLSIAYDNYNETKNTYTEGVPPRIYLGGTYNINDNNKIGALFHGEYFKKGFYPSFTVSYNYQLPKWIGASLSYTAMHRSFVNLGAGLSIRLGPVQIYAVSDNLAYLFNLAKITDVGVVPQTAKSAHARVGLNLVFIKKEQDKDGDGLINKEDECPDIAGPKEFNGCPDRDEDKIVDIHDNCPDEPGLAVFKGCPDRDGDKIMDKEDECPDIPGSKENKGCPVKLHLIDDVGNTVISAQLNKDGFFIYENLPQKEKYVFRLEASNADLIQEVQVLQTLDGNDNVLTALRNEDGLFIYEVLNTKETTLYLIDPMGDTIMMATKNDEGYFVFQPLPADQRHLFLLDGNEADLLDELLVLLIDDNGNEKVITASRDAANIFKYEYIPPIENSDLDLLEEEEVPAILLEEEKEIVKTAFNNLEFNFSSAVISFGSYHYLEELSKLLANKPDWGIKLSGHTDNVGSETANLLLSKKRAEAIQKVLINRGVLSDRIIVKYFGETQPVTENNTEDGKQRNRRVEMLIIEKEDAVNKPNTNLEIAFEGETGISFKVQVMASKKKIAITDSNFKGVKDVHEYFGNGLFKYTVGKSNDFDQIYNVILKALKEKGFKEAFIVSFKDGVRIPVSDALKLLND